MLINFIGMVFYIIYIIYSKVKKEDNIEILFTIPNENNYEQYKKIKKKHTIVYIIGTLVGLMFLILNEKKTVIVKEKLNISKSVSDISEIFVK